MSRRALTQWVLIAMSLLSGGCRVITEHRFQSLLHPRVCPTCTAVSVDQCRCFSGSEHAGYCETTWVSLDPMMGHGPVARPNSEHIEEIPIPASALPPQASHGRIGGYGVPYAPGIAPIATSRELAAQTPSHLSRHLVSDRITNEDDTLSDCPRPPSD